MTSLGPTLLGNHLVDSRILLAWRVGASGKLVVELELRCLDDAFSTIEIRGTWHLSGAGSPRAGSTHPTLVHPSTIDPNFLHSASPSTVAPDPTASSGLIVGTASLVVTQAGTDAELDADLRLDGPRVAEAPCAFLTVVRSRSTPVFLTDVPTALGLAGGTYVLASGTCSLGHAELPTDASTF